MLEALRGQGDLSERQFTALQRDCAFALGLWRVYQSHFDGRSFQHDHPRGADLFEDAIFEPYQLDDVPPAVEEQINGALAAIRTRVDGASKSDLLLTCTPQWLSTSVDGRADTDALLEGAAFIAEMVFRIIVGGYDDDPPEIPPSPYADTYLGMLAALERPLVLPGLEFHEYLALADLALNPVFSADSMMLCEGRGGLMDNLPPWRFRRALEVVAERVRPQDDLEAWTKNPDRTYCDWVSAICDELGWVPPWQVAKQVVAAAGSLEFLETHETQFLRSCSLRAEHPALLPLWPVHPLRSDAMTYIGLPNMAALDTGFKYFVTIQPSTDGSAYHFKWDGDRPDQAEASLFMELALIDVAVQLLYYGSDLDLDTDPRRILDEYGGIEGAHMGRVLRKVMLPADYWPGI
jgi:hypothetical protein